MISISEASDLAFAQYPKDGKVPPASPTA